MARFTNTTSNAILGVLSLYLLSSCGHPVLPMDASVKVKTLNVVCTETKVPKGVYFPCEAVAALSDGSEQKVTSLVTWNISDPTVASPVVADDPSRIQGLSPGQTKIRAAMGEVVGESLVTVTDAQPVSMALTPQSKTFRLGLQEQFTAICIFTDNSYHDVTNSVQWSSRSSSIAAISSTGMATAAAVGSTTIDAVFGSITSSAPVTVLDKGLVSLQISPHTASVIQGLTQNFQVTGLFTDLSTEDLTETVTWSVDDTALGTVSNTSGQRGRFTAVAVGSPKVSAVYSGISDTVDVTVVAPTLDSISISATQSTFPSGLSQSLMATGHYSNGTTANLTDLSVWSSSDTSVLTVSNTGGQMGLAEGVSVGMATVYASYGGVVGDLDLVVNNPTLISISLTPSGSSLAKGLTQQITATGNYSDGSHFDLTNFVTWGSSDPSVASVSNLTGQQGQARANALGTASLEAVLGSVTANTNMTVTAAVLASIALTPSSLNMAKGLTQQFAATGTYTDGTTSDLTSSATWSSDATSVATVNNAGSKGLATAAGIGSAGISVVLSGVTGSVAVTVTAPTVVSIAVTPGTATVAKGLTQQFVATATYTDGSTSDVTSSVTWSSNSSAVTVSNTSGSRGLATGAGVGSATVTATLGSVSGTSSMTVTAAELVSIAVTPANSTIVILTQVQFTATGTYTDGSTANITTSVTWSSSNTTTATISNSAGSQGRASGLGLGTTTIRATSGGGIIGSTTLNGIL